MSNLRFILFSKNGCPYSQDAYKLLEAILTDDNHIIADTVDELKGIIETKRYNIENNDKYNKHNTAPLVFYGNEKRLLFIGGYTELKNLFDDLQSNHKIYFDKLILNK